MGRKSPGTYLGAFAIVGLAFFLAVFAVRVVFILALMVFNLSVFLIKISFKICGFFLSPFFGKSPAKKPSVQKKQSDKNETYRLVA